MRRASTDRMDYRECGSTGMVSSAFDLGAMTGADSGRNGQKNLDIRYEAMAES